MHDQEGDGEPAHHARRPMNAFLIFCKRHRSVVRDKYPNLENRSITKILGEWWANLDKEEKACYTGLAKQYKDAFFSANPDFKWYKLPAPPLRTLSSRPRDSNEKPVESPNSDQHDQELEKTNNNSTKGVLTETSKIFEQQLQEKKRIYYGIPNDQFTNQDVIDQIVDKRYSKDDEYGCQRNWSDDEKNMRSDRSCKGKRYQEFMAVGGLIVNKRQKRDSDKPDENYSATCSWDPGSLRDDTMDDEPNNSNDKPADCDDKLDTADMPEPDNNANKTFKAADFDLDAKIRALPSLSLEKFQQKKRENKRKKKTVNLKPKALETSQIVNSVPRSMMEERRETAEHWRDTVIGSQKRKPRKISITRLEINSMVSSVDLEAQQTSPQMKIATEAPAPMCRQSPLAGDLLALATLAEVASNTSKLDDSAMHYMTAKASDSNASMV
ncbi:uncharacterized protein LOC118267420 isoform X2 [Spodoptera frugiperda]|uniref:Uncharacterized protein LOC118267420 isoform X2 n=1 Tax=Spodoptera frugiperda TaxID=7108 RepID=A0A9R0EJA6_SPOFR|nr:uncharacterized protein LOC118267420 isoform X2 [Spodoptera frugiperda]